MPVFTFYMIIDIVKFVISLFTYYLLNLLCSLFLFSTFFQNIWIFLVSILSLCWLISYNFLLCYFAGYFKILVYIFNLSLSIFKWYCINSHIV